MHLPLAAVKRSANSRSGPAGRGTSSGPSGSRQRKPRDPGSEQPIQNNECLGKTWHQRPRKSPRGDGKEAGRDAPEKLEETFQLPPPTGVPYWNGPALAQYLHVPSSVVLRYRKGIHVRDRKVGMCEFSNGADFPRPQPDSSHAGTQFRERKDAAGKPYKVPSAEDAASPLRLQVTMESVTESGGTKRKATALSRYAFSRSNDPRQDTGNWRTVCFPAPVEAAGLFRDPVRHKMY